MINFSKKTWWSTIFEGWLADENSKLQASPIHIGWSRSYRNYYRFNIARPKPRFNNLGIYSSVGDFLEIKTSLSTSFRLESDGFLSLKRELGWYNSRLPLCFASIKQVDKTRLYFIAEIQSILAWTQSLLSRR